MEYRGQTTELDLTFLRVGFHPVLRMRSSVFQRQRVDKDTMERVRLYAPLTERKVDKKRIKENTVRVKLS